MAADNNQTIIVTSAEDGKTGLTGLFDNTDANQAYDGEACGTIFKIKKDGSVELLSEFLCDADSTLYQTEFKLGYSPIQLNKFSFGDTTHFYVKYYCTNSFYSENTKYDLEDPKQMNNFASYIMSQHVCDMNIQKCKGKVLISGDFCIKLDDRYGKLTVLEFSKRYGAGYVSSL